VGQLRLAERQGLLRGKKLSPVQQFGLRMLILMDQQEAEDRRTEDMRLALLSAKPELARGLYPSYFDPVEIVEDDGTTPLDQAGVDYDYSGVQWQSSSELGDPEMDMLGQMLGNKDVIVTGPPRATEGVEDQLLRLNFDESEDSEWT